MSYVNIIGPLPEWLLPERLPEVRTKDVTTHRDNITMGHGSVARAAPEPREPKKRLPGVRYFAILRVLSSASAPMRNRQIREAMDDEDVDGALLASYMAGMLLGKFIVAGGEPRRREYTITEAGRTYLAENDPGRAR